MRCRMTASLRATATAAFRSPLRLARLAAACGLLSGSFQIGQIKRPTHHDALEFPGSLVTTVRARMPADNLGIRPELHIPGAAAQTRTVSGADFGRSKRQLSRDLKYIGEALLEPSFLSSSPTCPATQRGLCGHVWFEIWARAPGAFDRRCDRFSCGGLSPERLA